MRTRQRSRLQDLRSNQANNPVRVHLCNPPTHLLYNLRSFRANNQRRRPQNSPLVNRPTCPLLSRLDYLPLHLLGSPRAVRRRHLVYSLAFNRQCNRPMCPRKDRLTNPLYIRRNSPHANHRLSHQPSRQICLRGSRLANQQSFRRISHHVGLHRCLHCSLWCIHRPRPQDNHRLTLRCSPLVLLRGNLLVNQQ